jgi:hypothetical protein
VGIVNHDPQELSDTLMRDERVYIAKWLALEILMTDETVREDNELFNRLTDLQDRWQQETLARRGLIADDATGADDVTGKTSGTALGADYLRSL